MESIGLTALITLGCLMLLFLFLFLIVDLIHEKLVRSLENSGRLARIIHFLVFVNVEYSQDHIGEHVVLNFITLFDGNVLEVLLVVNAGE